VRRRDAVAIAVFGLGSGMARAQPTARVRRVCLLRPTSPAAGEFMHTGMPEAFAQHGLVQGRNLQLVVAAAGGDVSRLPAMARDLAGEGCEVIVAVGASAVRAALDAGGKAPIVMFGNFDPVAYGFVTDLARPGGRATGVMITPDGTLAGKRLELLREAVPRSNRLGFLQPNDPGVAMQRDEVLAAASRLGVGIHVATVRNRDYESAFSELHGEKVQGVLLCATTYFRIDRQTIIDQVHRRRLPTMWEWPDEVREGGLMAYGTNLRGLYLRVAHYAQRILAGESAGSLPIERPTRFSLVVNRRAAAQIGMVLPTSLLLRADEVVE